MPTGNLPRAVREDYHSSRRDMHLEGSPRWGQKLVSLLQHEMLADVARGSKAEKLRLSKCLLLFPQQRTFIKATAANSTRIDAARNKPPHPELIDKFADWLIALSSGGLFVFNSNFLSVNEAHRSGADKRQRFDHPPPWA